MSDTENGGNRKRALSLRTRMFNKHLFDKYTADPDTIHSIPIDTQDVAGNAINGHNNDDNTATNQEGMNNDDININNNNNNETGDDINNDMGVIPEEQFEVILDDDLNDIDDHDDDVESNNIGFITKIIDLLLDRRRILKSKDGRHIPICLDHNLQEFKNYTNDKYGSLLIDERTNKPYCNNTITSSRYTVYSFLPKQLYAQFSRVANIYFFVIAILQMIPGWSTTGTYTTIIPLLVFMGISMVREAWDDFQRHRLDKEENMKDVTILTKDINAKNEEKISNTQLDEFNIKNDMATDIPTTHFTNFKLLQENHDVYLQTTQWKHLKVGDFVVLKQDDWVPADLLLLTCNGENNETFIETMALDGETNLKNRSPHIELNKLASSASGLANINAIVTVEDPNNDLYNFDGNLELQDSNYNTLKKYPIGPENVIYRGSIVRNTPFVVGMVIFTGEESKIRMNATKNPRVKAPKLQKQINLIIVFMVFVVACVSFFSYLGHVLAKRKTIAANQAWYLFQEDAGAAATIMSFIIMFNTMIPLSLYVTMEIIKIAQSKLMELDIDMYYKENDTPMESRTATILEELGQVSYIFSDKTGTLTDNKMIFRKFSLLGSSWFHNTSDLELTPVGTIRSSVNTDLEVMSIKNPNIINNLRHNNFQITNDMTEPRKSISYKGNSSATFAGRPSMSSLYEANKFHVNSKRDSIYSHETTNVNELKTSYDLINFIQKYPNKLFSQKAKFFILSLALCHVCLPKRVKSDDDLEDTIEYQSSSPDELALITAARELGFVLINKNAQILTIKSYPNGFDNEPHLENYEILNYIDFNSKRKRMSVIVKMPNEPNRVLLICKGADNVILERLYNSDIAMQKLNEISDTVTERKEEEAELIIQQRKSLERMMFDDVVGRNSLRSIQKEEGRASLSLQAIRKSISRANKNIEPEGHIASIDDILDDVKKSGQEIDDVIKRSKKSLSKQQLEKYGPRLPTEARRVKETKEKARFNINAKNNTENDEENGTTFQNDMLEYIGQDDLLLNQEYVIEKTIQAIDEFSTEGLRTLLFGYKWIDNPQYEIWSEKYNIAKSSLVNRQEKTEAVGAGIENNLSILGATAIEDKLQNGVTEAIEKIKRAGIKMWMLTGDKRETAINIGYSCKLIYDYSTVVILTKQELDIISKMNAISQEVDTGNVAHCVIVIDGATLSLFETNPMLMSVFMELCTKTDSVICCRASPAQKALLVNNIRNVDKNKVTLAIGDGANDIAMIQSADIGVGIAGKEGLQASRTSDYSIAQFRFLLKLLFVHGRYNYIRTAKFVLCTFYKELTFYMTQVIFQRYTLFSGTSLYEPWSLSMFNTLFTSLPVLCIGIFEKDLKPITLLSVPELYSFGRLSEGFNIWIFLEWMVIGACNAVMITFLNTVVWGESSLIDNTLYPVGVINFTAIVMLINFKAQILEMRNKSWVAFASIILSCGGWLVWCCALPVLNRSDGIYDVSYGFFYEFGTDISFWCTCFILSILPIVVDIIYQTIKKTLWPTDSDIFGELEKKSSIRKKLELDAYTEMEQGWTWEHDPNSIKRYKGKLFGNKHHNSENEHINVANNTKRSSGAFSGLSVRSESFELTKLAEDPRLSNSNKSQNSNFAHSETKSVLQNNENETNVNENHGFDITDDIEILPSGKIIKKQELVKEENELENVINEQQQLQQGIRDNTSDNSSTITRKITKKLRFRNSENDDEDVLKMISERMKDLE